MDMKKLISYIVTVIIGIGFIMMAVSNTLHNKFASILQVILGIILIIGSIKKTIEVRRK